MTVVLEFRERQRSQIPHHRHFRSSVRKLAVEPFEEASALKLCTSHPWDGMQLGFAVCVVHRRQLREWMAFDPPSFSSICVLFLSLLYRTLYLGICVCNGKIAAASHRQDSHANSKQFTLTDKAVRCTPCTHVSIKSPSVRATSSQCFRWPHGTHNNRIPRPTSVQLCGLGLARTFRFWSQHILPYHRASSNVCPTNLHTLRLFNKVRWR